MKALGATLKILLISKLNLLYIPVPETVPLDLIYKLGIHWALSTFSQNQKIVI